MNFIKEKIKITEDALALAITKSEINKLTKDLLGYKHLLLIAENYSKEQIEKEIEKLEKKITIIKDREPKNPQKNYPEIKQYQFQLKNLI